MCASAVGSMVGRVVVSSMETFKATGTNIICLSAVSEGRSQVASGTVTDLNTISCCLIYDDNSGAIHPRFSFLA